MKTTIRTNFVSCVSPELTRGTNIDYRWNSFIAVCFRLLRDYTAPLSDCWTLTSTRVFCWWLVFLGFFLRDSVTFKRADAKFSH